MLSKEKEDSAKGTNKKDLVSNIKFTSKIKKI